jgi:lysophospholipase L1-like esterase
MRIWSKYLTALHFKLRYLTPRIEPDCFRILCYGDSNTWGYMPGSGFRFSANVRWPGVLQSRLGSKAIVFEEGLCGRTTMVDDPTAPGRNGHRTLMPILKHYAPLDFIVLNLGTNDLKARFDQSAISIANGAKLLCQKAQVSDCGRAGVAPDILLVAPPPITHLTSTIRAEFDGAVLKSKLLAKHFSDMASQLNIHFLDAAEFITPSITDPIHWDGSAHQIIGQIVADSVKPILSKLKLP